MILWLVRHPAVEVAAGICYGRSDVALREPAPFAAIEARLPPVGAIRTSPATRCRRLADHVAVARGLAAVADERWQELDFGAWEGRAWDTIPRGESDPWATSYWTLAPPGGETYAALAARVREALATIAAAGDAAVVTHAGPIRAAIGFALGAPDRLPDIEVPWGAVIGLKYAGGAWTRC